jgi:peptidylprolyl isomerase
VTNSNPLSTLRTRAIVALAVLAGGALIAGCGSSGSSSTITVGAENSADNALAKASAGAKASETATTAAATTPTSGPLSKEPTVTVSTAPAPSKLIVKDVIVGTGPEAKAGESLTVNYVGALYKGGKVFDASWKRNEPFTFALGKGQVIAGWDQGLVGMKVGGRRQLIIPASLGYGARGSGSSIPPNAALVFVVDLLGT